MRAVVIATFLTGCSLAFSTTAPESPRRPGHDPCAKQRWYLTADLVTAGMGLLMIAGGYFTSIEDCDGLDSCDLMHASGEAGMWTGSVVVFFAGLSASSGQTSLEKCRELSRSELRQPESVPPPAAILR